MVEIGNWFSEKNFVHQVGIGIPLQRRRTFLLLKNETANSFSAILWKSCHAKIHF